MDDPETAGVARQLWERHQNSPRDLSNDPLELSEAQTNCGTIDEEDQLVSITGQNVHQSPSASDIRGPYPGLNATANHGYLPRNGIATIEQTVSGLQALYNMQPALAIALSAYAVATDGNVLEGVWSIGGPLPKDYLVDGRLGTGQGLSYSHNAYEGDSSIGRNDIYLNNGRCTLPKHHKVRACLRRRWQRGPLHTRQESIDNNPCYFTGAFSTIVVVPAAYNFVINFMSNHTKEEPSGYLDGYNFKTFFGVSGEPGSFKWLPSQERVPENWYRRPSANQYTAPDVFIDVGIGYAAYPDTLKFGGNTRTPNSFVDLNVANFTRGIFSTHDLFKGDNLACFSFSVLQQGIPNFLSTIVNDLAPVTSFVNKYVGPLVGGLNCPEIKGQTTGLFNDFPVYKYSPTGPDTNH
ncbi:Chloroperoxidase [Rhexocercosporidium sp. MPI-PUGE-AT-0058]|nr:Chloroperoxidase [Rhexocercosporidium sp. MPI-PUGE-AT-0058]